MPHDSVIPRLIDIIEASARLREVAGDLPLAAFEADWQKQWLVERGVEIISEASRGIPPEIKQRYPTVPWAKVAGIGNILRHDYGNVSAPLMWQVVQDHLPELERVCRLALAVAQAGDDTPQ